MNQQCYSGTDDLVRKERLLQQEAKALVRLYHSAPVERAIPDPGCVSLCKADVIIRIEDLCVMADMGIPPEIVERVIANALEDCNGENYTDDFVVES